MLGPGPQIFFPRTALWQHLLGDVSCWGPEFCRVLQLDQKRRVVPSPRQPSLRGPAGQLLLWDLLISSQLTVFTYDATPICPRVTTLSRLPLGGWTTLGCGRRLLGVQDVVLGVWIVDSLAAR